MQLFYSDGSPYARAVRIALRESGRIGAVREIPTALREPGAAVLPHNPVGRVPTLVLADGTALTETALILPFLGAVPAERLADFGQVLGLLEGIAVWNRELRRPPEERSPGVIALEVGRAGRVTDALEAALAGWPAADPPDGAHILLASALAYGDRRHQAWVWRPGRPRLVAFSAALEARPAFLETYPPERRL